MSANARHAAFAVVLLVLSITSAATTGGAAAADRAISPYRFYAKDMSLALRTSERSNDRRPGMKATHCRGSDGNKTIGYRHIVCVGNYTFEGTTFRFQIFATPIACLPSMFTVSEAFSLEAPPAQVTIMNWKGGPFFCRRS